MMTAKALFRTYILLGFQNYAPTNEGWAQKWLDAFPSWVESSDLIDAAHTFKAWVADNNAFDTNNNLIG